MNAPPPSLEHLSKLAPQLAKNGVEVTSVHALAGGASQELWRVVVRSDAGETHVVLRRSPQQRIRSELAVPIGVEAELILSAHDAGIPSPRMIYVLQPEDGLGVGFFMEHVEGEALGHRIVRHDS